jgi:outer membrane protein assembly factor BamA
MIPNVWTLDLQNGQLRQWTDTATGNLSPVVLRQEEGLRVAFVSYYKGQFSVHAITGEQPVAVVDSADFGGPGPVFDFTAPLSHTLLRDNVRRKGAFEKMSLAGRPPVALGVTSGGDLYGNTQVTFTDVLGDKEVSFYAQSVLQYRTTAFTYLNIGRRFNYAIQGYAQDLFYFGQDLTRSGALFDPTLAPFIDRDLAEAVQSQKGATFFGIYPFNRYARVQLSGGYLHMNERYRDDGLQALAEQYQIEQFGTTLFRNGHMMPFGASLIRDTSVFRPYGPVSGSLVRATYDIAPSLGDTWLSKQTFSFDGRYYLRMVANGVLAVRLYGQRSWGNTPDFFNFGGNSEMRGYQYLEFIGQKGFFANAELRFPLIEAMLTPIGVLGGLRGTLFANLGAAGFNSQPFKLLSTTSEAYDALVGYDLDVNGNVVNVRTESVDLSGLRLIDGRASYGLGLQSFLLGFPMHFDFSWRTLFNREWESALFRNCTQTTSASIECSPSGDFRKMEFDFWIGYDF